MGLATFGWDPLPQLEPSLSPWKFFPPRLPRGIERESVARFAPFPRLPRSFERDLIARLVPVPRHHSVLSVLVL